MPPLFIHILKPFKSYYMPNSPLGSGNKMGTKLDICLLTSKNIMKERDISEVGPLIKV